MSENSGVPAIEKSVQAIYAISSDERAKEYIRMREKALLDRTSELEAAENKGIAEGRAEMLRDVIANMRAMGASEEMISNIEKL